MTIAITALAVSALMYGASFFQGSTATKLAERPRLAPEVTNLPLPKRQPLTIERLPQIKETTHVDQHPTKPVEQLQSVQKPTTLDRVLSIVSFSDRPAILKAATIPRMTSSTRHPFDGLGVGIQVKNTTGKALSELTVLALLKSDRTVPYGFKTKTIDIPGGIEIAETKLLQVNFVLGDFNIPGELPPDTLPEDTDFLVGILIPSDWQRGSRDAKAWEIGVPLTPAPYHWRQLSDPAVQELMNVR
jgi:hypothetical protein